jgi:hypothetical protein
MRWADRAVTLGAIGVVGALLAGPAPAAAQPASEPTSKAPGAVLDRVLRDPRIIESSGLAVSRRHDGVLWTHNDSGDGARLYAIGPDGSTFATVTLAGVDARDWEAMASSTGVDGTALLWIGDIGDNAGTRDNGILVHRVVEPAELADAQVQPTTYRLRYPGVPVDAESLLVDPRNGRLIVITKAPVGGTVYGAPLALDPERPNVLEPLGDAPDLLTDAAFSPDGRMLVRGYGAMRVGAPDFGWSAPVALPPTEQGESLAVSADGAVVYVGSEGARSRVWRLAPPAVGSRESAPSPTAATGPPDIDADADADDSAEAYGMGWGLPLLVGALALTVSLILLLARRRRRRR